MKKMKSKGKRGGKDKRYGKGRSNTKLPSDRYK